MERDDEIISLKATNKDLLDGYKVKRCFINYIKPSFNYINKFNEIFLKHHFTLAG